MMGQMIEKYEAKLEFLNKSLEKTKHLMGEDILEMVLDVKILLEEVVSDFKSLEEKEN